MNICMLTNTYLPHVGGVANSVAAFTRELRHRGHRVLVVAPEMDAADGEATEADENCLRLPAVQNFNGSDFSLRLPIPVVLYDRLRDFEADIFHSHHPFLLGNAAIRLGALYGKPVLFTHHTRYEHYTHYVPGDSETLRRLAIELSSGYCNLVDRVIAPSDGIRHLLRERGVHAPITVIPTGVKLDEFSGGDGRRWRGHFGWDADALVVGHLGRLAEEKNLGWLTEAVGDFLEQRPDARFLVVGDGRARQALAERFTERGLDDRLGLTGALRGQDVVDAYAAMDVFAFASKSETQGMVLTEAMALGCPVVALEATGVTDVLDDGTNGRLIADDDREAFVAALAEIAEAPESWREAALATARDFSLERTTDQLIEAYEQTERRDHADREEDEAALDALGRIIGQEWELWRLRFHSLAESVGE